MKPSRIIKNLTRIGIALGFVFPIGSLVFDLFVRGKSFSPEGIAYLYEHNPLHWVILSAPIVLGGSFYYLARRIADREQVLHAASEKDKRQIAHIENYINEIGNGNLNAELPEEFDNESLANVLYTFRDKLEQDRTGADRRRWINEGIAQVGDILRQYEDIDALSYNVIKKLVDYCDMNQGGVFIVDEQEDGEVQLELKGCYAYQRKKFLEKRIAPGQGLVGQCYMEKEPILLYDVPKEYVQITSGLGQANPTCIVIMPLKTDDTIEGVIELAGFKKITDHEMDFLKRVCESTASVIKNVKTNEQTKKLLVASQEQAEMMRSQEEEMRQNMEELSATQEEMQRKEKEFMKQIREYRERFGEL